MTSLRILNYTVIYCGEGHVGRGNHAKSVPDSKLLPADDLFATILNNHLQMKD
jgi:hypothetical protein